MENFKFETIKKCKQSGARIGKLYTPSGVIETPVFMPVGTQATVKGLTAKDLDDVNAQIILSNTYHLYLRPGHKLIEKAGGLHSFMNYKKPILTDSGGFQVFSLSKLNKVTDEGVEFASHLSGEKHFFTPERAIQIQNSLGADIIMAFDECTGVGVDKEYAKKSVNRTINWLDRCFNEHKNKKQALFPIVQGNFYKDLRLESLEKTIPYAKHGIAIGGLSVGEPVEIMYEILDTLKDKLPENVPHYLMGVGRPDNIIESVIRNIDMFDCVLPTRIARNGTALTRYGKLVIKNSIYKEDLSPIEDSCKCFACRNHTRAYIRHLINTNEMLGAKLITIHNLHFMNKLTEDIKKAIMEDRLLDFRDEFYKKLKNKF